MSIRQNNLFAEYGLPVSQGFACDTPQEAAAAAEKSAVICGLLKLRFTQVDVVKLAV